MTILSDNVFKVTRHDMKRQFEVCEEDAFSLGCSSNHFNFPGSMLPSDQGTAPLLGVDGEGMALFPESHRALQLCLRSASIAPSKSAGASMQCSLSWDCQMALVGDLSQDGAEHRGLIPSLLLLQHLFPCNTAPAHSSRQLPSQTF